MTSQSVLVSFFGSRLRPNNRPTVKEVRGVETKLVRWSGLGRFLILIRPNTASAICPAEIIMNNADGPYALISFEAR